MYRDSDGYILIDMGAADISKSTQSIVGFYDRIVESVEANKLVLVINFGTYSPMPAIAHKKLNYYEIVTNLYKITINSNDIVIIEETGESTVDVSIVPTLQEGVKIADFAIGEVEGSIYAPEQIDVINDNVTAENTTWSSDKINNELDKKADSSSLSAVATSGSYADLTNKPTIPTDLDDLGDVTLTAPANGQTLVYDSTSEQFVNATPPSGVTTLAALTDVSLTTPASGNSLVFDGTEWANDTLAADDIPYSQGVSVADKLDDLTDIKMNHITSLTAGTPILSRLLPFSDGTNEYKASIADVVSSAIDYQYVYPSSVNVPYGSFKEIASLTLNKGTYIVTGYHEWTSGFADNYVDQLNGQNVRNLSGQNGGGYVFTSIFVITNDNTNLSYQTYLYGSTARTASNISLKAIKIK